MTDAAELCIAQPNMHDFIFLLETEESLLANILEADFTCLKALLGTARSVLWARLGGHGNAPTSPDYAVADGLLRVNRVENRKVRVVSLALETVPSPTTAANISKVFRTMMLQLQNCEDTPETEFSEVDGRLTINRLRKAGYLDEHIIKRTTQPVIQEQIENRRLKLGIRVPGLLDTIEFVDDDTCNRPIAAEEVDVEVVAIGLNFKDLMTLLGRTKTEDLGSECAGVVRDVRTAAAKCFKIGDRVCLNALDCFRTYKRVHMESAWRIPDGMTFTEAASLPTAYGTAIHCLKDVARLEQGESILIHAASGGTGQAVIQIAQNLGAEVFATVGSTKKKNLLMDVYRIPEDHILYSRDASFAEGIKRLTNSRGVDVIINSVSGRLLDASLACIAPHGRFVEIGLKDVFEGRQLPLATFAKGISFSAIDMGIYLRRTDGTVGKKTAEMFGIIETESLTPAHPLHVYSIKELVPALRLLQSGQSSGKIIVEVDRSVPVPVSDEIFLLLCGGSDQ